ncbi:ORF6N domain-containing protein [Pedobacter gandavensis]|uniref:ORF6N domain-containing protein n=1 Tax=Pedobacter gandavensis TaxID=2679963 RepID=UPI00292E885E|nr:ORF6N domain-containing protein [Pedobacter gandavensis]
MSPLKNVTIPDEVVMSKIYVIRDQKVMLDEDLAELYGVETRRLNEQVKRNKDRFPEDFMFTLTEDEFVDLKSQNATSSWGGRRKLPNAFTEHGVLMLSSVLNSPQSIQVNIQIMRIYIRIREMLLAHKDVFIRVEKVEKHLMKHDQKIELLFTYLSKFIEKEDQPRTEIGFKRKGE